MANSKGVGCGTIILVVIAVGAIGQLFNPDKSDDVNATPTNTSWTKVTPRSTPNSTPFGEAECTTARGANEDFVDVMNALDRGELSNASAAKEIGLVEDSLDALRKTVTFSKFQSAILGHANIVGLARMSLENNDITSYDFAVKEFILNAGYFRPYCG